MDALAGAGIVPEPQWLIETAPTRLEAATQAGSLFVRDPAPTAAVAYNDAVALGLMMGLASRGRRPGHDFAVVGFDDIPESSVSVPPLTTVATDPRARGRQAAQLILERIGNRQAAPAATIAPVRLVVRQSACVALDFHTAALQAAVSRAAHAPAEPAPVAAPRLSKPAKEAKPKGKK
jgi:LacI family transcriptional regulator